MGRDLAQCLATLDLCTVLAQGSSWPGKMSAWAFHGRRTGGATPPGRTHNSGTVAAAGVVNQADEQRILLPGYFTTPGLHPTHPLQASVAGPQGTGTWGQGGLGQLTVKDDVQHLSHTSYNCLGSFRQMPVSVLPLLCLRP